MSRWDAVKSEGEHRQDKCLHKLERVDPKKEHGFRWHCRECGKWMYRKNGIVVRDTVGEAEEQS